MDEEESITQKMIIEHGKIYDLISQFYLEVGYSRDIKEAKDIFKRFKGNHDKHLSFEENVVFKFKPFIREIYVLKIISKQHVQMNELISKIDKDLKKGKSVSDDINLFQNLSRAHIHIEETQFCPILDEKLNKEERLKLINKMPIFV